MRSTHFCEWAALFGIILADKHELMQTLQSHCVYVNHFITKTALNAMLQSVFN